MNSTSTSFNNLRDFFDLSDINDFYMLPNLEKVADREEIYSDSSMEKAPQEVSTSYAPIFQVTVNNQIHLPDTALQMTEETKTKSSRKRYRDETSTIKKESPTDEENVDKIKEQVRRDKNREAARQSRGRKLKEKESYENELAGFDKLTKDVNALMKKQKLVSPTGFMPVTKQQDKEHFFHLNRSSQREAIHLDLKNLILKGNELEIHSLNQQKVIEDLRKENESLNNLMYTQTHTVWIIRQQLEAENQNLKNRIKTLESEKPAKK